ncbi:hypothetical protein KIN20_011569 [Parelaphostrongylus tenuis]|uniref:Kinetochore protein Nuf2 N-terminal domain-containing protein n=1 Tax=Parelaphostrongylus tenuis TaxID=148309 RepID=A0AAD5N0D0_PARTN|nr:hypothetical protein KIN20_011569 [Parelaphostrongylus tenuis]
MPSSLPTVGSCLQQYSEELSKMSPKARFVPAGQCLTAYGRRQGQSFRNVFDSSRPRSIVDALTCLNVDINVEDVVHPKADRIQLIYNAFCTQILGVPEKSLSELPFDCNCNSETAELHQRSIPLTLLFTTMRCFTTDFGDESCDFTMCDLLNPQPKRTRRLLSLLADFTNFNMKASHIFEKTVAEYDEARQAVNAAQERVRLAEERRNALRSGLDLRKRKENEVLVELSAKQER